MKPLDLSLFGTDPWWLVLIKVVVLFVLLLVWTIFNVWYERRLVAKMQHRLGPIMNGPFGLGQAVADGTKLIFKEDFRPVSADRILFTLAPLIAGTAALTAWAVIPFGGEVEIFGVRTRLQLTDLPISVLVILAVASVGIYGFVLAGWSSNSPYSLLGALRSSAQMISYELSMGLALVGVFLYASSMSTSEIVEAQARPTPFNVFGLVQFQTPVWNAFSLLAPLFIVYVISMVGETNRAPFDLPECESELVSGYLTEYSGFRYAAFFLAEYINMATVSAVATTLFLGGYLAPWPLSWLLPAVDGGWWGPLWFMLKVQLLISVFVWLRGTLPRFRYDQFMTLGWKWLIPFALVWVMIVAALKVAQNLRLFANPMVVGIAGAVAVVAFGVWWWLDTVDEPEPEPERPEKFDAFAGGYPVPPMEGETLPELDDVVPSTTDETERVDA